MNAHLASWWRLRTRREQRLLLVMTALLLAVAVWLLIVRPADRALARARMRHDAAVLMLAHVRGGADMIHRLEAHAPSPIEAPLETFIGQQAVEAGFTGAHVAPGGGTAALSIDAVRPRAFFPWVADMERRHGLVVDNLTARTNSDATLAVQATFRARER